MKYVVIAIVTIVIVAALTVLYKVMPHRELGSKRPKFSLFPKYRNKVPVPESDDHIEKVMSSLGFEKKKDRGGLSEYSRGFIAGDISIKLAKVKVIFYQSSEGKLPYTVEAAWIAAFDTGDHWKFAKELGDKLENA
ncbi:hypothetical protein [Hydrocarboniclastica marina]|uniref:Uncharacterized protein n=1 Tax=Hydrocarboniclastica marina TaxID=2259620 RepID=A0A4P7XDB3_9ALTE|nr:hypothetical protein [Hydrocarboniclastica marina]QCF24831.1 hypothetical protein soil367_02030 [Hydrocarboniclastica marina]QCF25923.1 hypothetical protein soil367_08325 [Hydrocarboniclastica marina]